MKKLIQPLAWGLALAMTLALATGLAMAMVIDANHYPAASVSR